MDTEILMSRLSDDVFTAIRQKYNDVEENFTQHFTTDGFDFNCHTSTPNSNDGRTFIGIHFDLKTREVKATASTPTLIETAISVKHSDCYTHLIFTERMRIVASSAKAFTREDAVKFKRVFVTEADESIREYSIDDESGRTLFAIRSEKKGTPEGLQIHTSTELGGRQWMTTEQTETDSGDRRFIAHFLSGEYLMFGGRVTFYFGVPALEFRQHWNSKVLTHDILGTPTSKSSFDEQIQDLTVNVTGIYLKAVLANFILKFPETVHVMAGVSDSPFLRELQLNRNRLIQDKEKAQIRQFFDKTIQDIKEGRLKVE